MHGRKKSDVKSQAEQDHTLKKVKIFSSTIQLLFVKRKQGDTSIETLDLISKLLLSNPDVYTVWNYRREILIMLYERSFNLSMTSETKVSHDVGSKVRDEELKLTEECIKRNPKSCMLTN